MNSSLSSPYVPKSIDIDKVKQSAQNYTSCYGVTVITDIYISHFKRVIFNVHALMIDNENLQHCTLVNIGHNQRSVTH